MKNDTFKEFISDQLRGLGRVECRPMFGGYGLYHTGIFFGILFNGRLYFKTDPATLPSYLERGMKPFRPNAKQTLMRYYEVPAEIVEDPDQLTAWAEQAAQGEPPDGASSGRRRPLDRE